MKLKSNLILAISILLLLSSCVAIKEVSQALNNIKNLEYKLDNLGNFSLAGVDISQKRKISDFSIQEGLKLTQAFSSKKIPAQFVLNVNAKNPNDGTDQTTKTNATLANLNWDLYIDNVKTISGDLATPVSVPSSGQAVNIPLRMNLDLYEFFGKQGYDKLINLALRLGGINSQTSLVRLEATPTVNTAIGPISSPRITIVDKEWR